MTTSRHQNWRDFSDLIASGHPAIVVVPGTPQTVLFSDSGASRVGLRIAWSGDPPSLRLNEIQASVVSVEGERYLEVSTRRSSIYQEFFAFACSLADRVQVDGESPIRALTRSLQSWNSLFSGISTLSVPEQAGLYGELWALRRLADACGWPAAVHSWKGPEAGEHDFSLEQHDIEVKTTTRERRVHTIQSASQLEPSPSRPLYVLSLQVTAGGLAGQTLAGAVEEVRQSVPQHLETALQEKLERAHWRSEHDVYYETRFILRTSPVVILVDQRFPRISSEHLALLDVGIRTRVLNVSYDIDLDGLGFEEASPEFLSVFPASEN